MATWQFDCVLIPRADVPLSSKDARQLLRDNSQALWSGRSVEALAKDLEEVLGKPDPTWTVDVAKWGANDSTCLQLAAIDGAIDELRLRIDMRFPEDDLLRNVLRFSRKVDLVVVTEVGDVVEPRLEWLMRSAGRSRAAAFVKDPERYLDGIASAPIEPDDEG